MSALPCPACHKTKSEVSSSRPVRAIIRRRRVCSACGHRWSTVEISEAVFKSLVRGDSADHRARVLKRIAEDLLELAEK